MKVDGANLAAARERIFMSQEELAEALSLNPVVVIRPEAAERPKVRENLGEDLAQILFVRPSVAGGYVSRPSCRASRPAGRPPKKTSPSA